MTNKRKAISISSSSSSKFPTKRRFFRTFKEACEFYKFPGSHQTGSYGPKDVGILRSYSNGTPGKDFIHRLPDGTIEILYKLKDDAYRQKFRLTMKSKVYVRVFRKHMNLGIENLGKFEVHGFTKSGHVRMQNIGYDDDHNEEDYKDDLKWNKDIPLKDMTLNDDDQGDEDEDTSK